MAEAEARIADSSKKPGQTYKPEWLSSWTPAAEDMRAALPDAHKDFRMFSPVLAGNAVAFLLENNDWGPQVCAINRADRSILWNIKLPGAPMANGMALTRAGEVLVPLNDGRLVCIGAEGDGIRPRAPVKTTKTEPGLLVEFTAMGESACFKTDAAAQFPVKTVKLDKPYLLRVSGLIDVAQTGKYVLSFYSRTSSSTLSVDGESEAIACKWGANSTAGLYLAKGKHSITILCPDIKEGTELIFRWQGPEDPMSELRADSLSHAVDEKEEK